MTVEIDDTPPGFRAWLATHPPAGWADAVKAHDNAAAFQSRAGPQYQSAAYDNAWRAAATLRRMLDESREKYRQSKRSALPL